MHKAGNDFCFLHCQQQIYKQRHFTCRRDCKASSKSQKCTAINCLDCLYEHLPDEDCMLLKCVVENTEQWRRKTSTATWPLPLCRRKLFSPGCLWWNRGFFFYFGLTHSTSTWDLRDTFLLPTRYALTFSLGEQVAWLSGKQLYWDVVLTSKSQEIRRSQEGSGIIFLQSWTVTSPSWCGKCDGNGKEEEGKSPKNDFICNCINISRGVLCWFGFLVCLFGAGRAVLVWVWFFGFAFVWFWVWFLYFCKAVDSSDCISSAHCVRCLRFYVYFCWI